MGKYAFIILCGFFIYGFVSDNRDTFQIRSVLVGTHSRFEVSDRIRRVPIFGHESPRIMFHSPDSGHVGLGDEYGVTSLQLAVQTILIQTDKDSKNATECISFPRVQNRTKAKSSLQCFSLHSGISFAV